LGRNLGGAAGSYVNFMFNIERYFMSEVSFCKTTEKQNYDLPNSEEFLKEAI
jgi:hypothetical protein